MWFFTKVPKYDSKAKPSTTGKSRHFSNVLHQASSEMCQPHGNAWHFLEVKPRKNGCCLVIHHRILAKVAEGHVYVIRLLEERPRLACDAQNMTCCVDRHGYPMNCLWEGRFNLETVDSPVHSWRGGCSASILAEVNKAQVPPHSPRGASRSSPIFPFCISLPTGT